MEKIFDYQGNEIVAANAGKSLFRQGIAMTAHRGSFFLGLPENSVPAFMLARQLGYQYIECDVRVTSDGGYVIMHDASINRTCRLASDYGTISETVNVATTTLSVLRNNYVLAADDPKYRTQIPTLVEYLLAVKDSDSIAMVELEPLTNAQVQEVYDLCVQYLGKGRFCFNSANYGELDYVRSIDTDIELHYETYPIIDTVSTIDGSTRNNPRNVWYTEYSGSYGTLNATIVGQYHALGMKVGAWTVPSAQLESLIAMGVDYVATNDIPCQMDGVPTSLVRFNANNTSDVDTNGTIANGKCSLTSGQYFKLPNNNNGTGVKCIRIWAKGSYTVTTNTKTYANSGATTTVDFSKTYNDSALTFHELYMFYNSASVPLLTITASGNTEIYSVDYYDVAINI